jgi:hypothetical protein
VDTLRRDAARLEAEIDAIVRQRPTTRPMWGSGDIGQDELGAKKRGFA